jgi:hypothetical protein
VTRDKAAAEAGRLLKAYLPLDWLKQATASPKLKEGYDRLRHAIAEAQTTAVTECIEIIEARAAEMRESSGEDVSSQPVATMNVIATELRTLIGM